MAKSKGVEDAQQRELVKDLMAKGHTQKEAKRQAGKILADQDRVEVDRNGKERPAKVGPEL